MKTIIRYITIIAAILTLTTHASSCVRVKMSDESLQSLAEWASPKALKGNGKITTKQIAAPEFKRLSAHRAAEVLLVEESVKQITVRADENVMPYVVITCREGALEITLDDAIKNVGEITFEVEVPTNKAITRLSSSSGAEIALKEGLTLDSGESLTLSSSSAGKIEGRFERKFLELKASSGAEIKGEFRTTKIHMDASSAAEIEGRVVAEELTANASSGASIELEGTAVKSELDASSGADIDAEKLTTTDCRAGASSGADIDCHCTGSLKASASSGGSIYNAGNPTSTEIQKSSGGSVTIAK